MKLSVIIPAFNEEKRISPTLEDIDHYLEKQPYSYEIIVVDNNSKDHTVAVVKELEATSVQNARILEETTKGKGAAVRKGVESATGDVILFMDADNATPISEIEKFFPYFEQGYAVVIGSREIDPTLLEIKQTLKRRLLGSASHLLIRMVLLPGIRDSQLGFKAFTSSAAKDIFRYLSIYGWGFDMEVLTIAREHHYRIREVGVRWREFGGSHVPLKAYIQSLRDLLKIRLNAWRGAYATFKNQNSKSKGTTQN